MPGPDARGLPLCGRLEQPRGQRAQERGGGLPGPGWLEGLFVFFDFFDFFLLSFLSSLVLRRRGSLSLIFENFYLCCEPPDGVGVLEPGPADPDPPRSRRRGSRSRSRWRSDRRRSRRRRSTKRRKSVACHRALCFFPPVRRPIGKRAVVGLRARHSLPVAPLRAQRIKRESDSEIDFLLRNCEFFLALNFCF